MTHAQKVAELLSQLVAKYNPAIDTSSGSLFYQTVTAKVLEYLGADLVNNAPEDFIRARMAQDYPSLNFGVGSSLADVLLRPLQSVLEPLREELAAIERADSLADPSTLTDDQVDALASRWFVSRREGTYATGTARIYVRQPVFQSIPITAQFLTADGLVFYPAAATFFQATDVLNNREGDLYYVDVPVVAEAPGSAYSLSSPNMLTTSKGLSGVYRIGNPYAFTIATDRETNEELLARVRSSISERSLTTRRGIRAALYANFPGFSDIEVVGFGDPEMQRDVLTGSGDGTPIASGVAFCVGTYVLLFSAYEDRGLSGLRRIAPGDTLRLNYWGFLYDAPADRRNEDISIRSIVFDSRDAITNMPSVVLLETQRAPSETVSMMGLLPGVLPFVFVTVLGEGRITIGALPDGVPADSTLPDGTVHIGGHYDVYVRTDDTALQSIDLTLGQCSQVLSGVGLRTYGESGDSTAYRVSADAIVTGAYTAAPRFADTIKKDGVAVGVVDLVTTIGGARAHITLSDCTAHMQRGDSVSIFRGSSEIGTLEVEAFSPGLGLLEYQDGLWLYVLTGTDRGAYPIIAVEGGYAYLDQALTRTSSNLLFCVATGVSIGLNSPVTVRLPFAGYGEEGLRTQVGTYTVELQQDAAGFGVSVGDVLEILSGEDTGTYVITAFGSTSRHLVLNKALSASRARVSYRISTTQDGLRPPFRRITPGGVTIISNTGADSSYIVPYAHPVGARALGAFSGGKHRANGLNGFILPDPGAAWAPASDTSPALEGVDSRTCYSDDCLPYDGYIACATLMSDGNFVISADVSADVLSFFSSLRTWLLDVISSFGLGDDAASFVNGAAPFQLGSPSQALLLDTPSDLFESGETVSGGAASGVVGSLYYLVELSSVTGSFTDSESVSGTGGAGAVTVVGATTLRVTATSHMVVGGTITGGTSGASATISGTQVCILFSSVNGIFVNEETVTGASSGASGEVVEAITPITQFEIILPESLFDGLRNTFVALPEFDWEATLSRVASLSAAVDMFRNGSLNGDLPALAYAQPGDALQLTSGSNAGVYLIERVYSFALCTLNTVVGDQADFDKSYKVCFVRIYGEFPVDTVGDLSGFFSGGLPDVSALPVGPAFPGTSFDTNGAPQSAWEWVQQTITWLFQFLNRMGFDLPSSVSLDPAEVLKVLWTALFTPYTVLRPSAPQTVRMYFMEPTALTLRAPQSVSRYGHREFVHEAAVLVGLSMTKVLGDVSEGSVVAVAVNGRQPGLVLSGELPDLSDVATVAELAAALQGVLDSDAQYVVFSGPEEDTGALTITSVELGIPVTLSLVEGTLPIWRLLGFEASGELSARITAPNPVRDSLKKQIYLDPASLYGFRISYIVSGPTVQADVNVAAHAPSAGYYTHEEVAGFLDLAMTAVLSAVSGFAISVWIDGENHTDKPTPTDRYCTYMRSTHSAAGLTFVSLTAPSTGTSLLSALGLSSSTVLSGSGVATIVGSEIDGWIPLELHVEAGTDSYDIEVAQGVVRDLPDPSDDFEAFVVALNAREELFDGENRLVYFVGGDELTVRTVAGGADASVELTATAQSGFWLLGFDDPSDASGSGAAGNCIAQGGTAAGDLTDKDPRATPPTLFIAHPGDVSIPAVPSVEVDPVRIYPSPSMASSELLRDLDFLPEIDGVMATQVWSVDEAHTPFFGHVTAGVDALYLYEERRMLEPTYASYEPYALRSRQVCVATFAGSPVIRIPGTVTACTFLSPESGAHADTPQIGDLVYLEEGPDAGAYTITARSDRTLTLDRALTASTPALLKQGTGAVYLDGGVTLSAGTFSQEDVGRYLVLWGSGLYAFDGCFEVSEVSSDGSLATLRDMETTLPSDAGQLHWCVISAPTAPPGASGVYGRTSLLGVVPIRIYNGKRTRWPVTYVEPTQDSEGSLTISYVDGVGPRIGERQPYQICREGVQAWTSYEMAQQRENGFFYVDATLSALSTEPIPALERFEPVRGTYVSDGYWVEVEDANYTLSAREKSVFKTSPSVTPHEAGESAQPIPLIGATVRISYESLPALSSAQTYLDAPENRNMCANSLIRSLLPTFVSFYGDYQGVVSPSDAGSGVADAVYAIRSGDPLTVGHVTRELMRLGVTETPYIPELFLVTHDLDRNPVLSWVRTTTEDEPEDYNGSHRTRALYPGTVYTADTGAYGEQIVMRRVVPRTRLR